MEKDCFSICNTVVVISNKVMAESFPEVKEIPLDKWDFFISLLAFRMCLEIIKDSEYSFEEQEKFFIENLDKFRERHPSFMEGFEHLIITLEENSDVITDSSTNMGLWLSTNLFEKDAAYLDENEARLGILTVNLIIESLIEHS